MYVSFQLNLIVLIYITDLRTDLDVKELKTDLQTISALQVRIESVITSKKGFLTLLCY